jgi:nucleolar GTP-binding protein
MDNPFSDFFHVPNSQELLDIAFKKAMKSSAQVSKNAAILIKAKKKEHKRIKVAIDEIINRVLLIIKRVPIIKELPEFYKELASLIVDIDELRLTLGKLNGTLPILSQIEREASKRLSQIETPKDADQIRRQTFGRISSIVNKQNQNLLYLNEIRGGLRKIPSLDYASPCVVVAGYPNVGKSSIVKLVSTNKKIDVQEYPFTTKELNLGHLEIQRRFDTIKIQIMDTPGILDRPMTQRNNIELKAILALRVISDLILFIFDPTPACGYSIESQIELYQEVHQNFVKEAETKMFIVINKMDLASSNEIHYLLNQLELDENDYILTNALTGENIDKLIFYLHTYYSEMKLEL